MKFYDLKEQGVEFPSHPARGAWIEMSFGPSLARHVAVAPRKGCVD